MGRSNFRSNMKTENNELDDNHGSNYKMPEYSKQTTYENAKVNQDVLLEDRPQNDYWTNRDTTNSRPGYQGHYDTKETDFHNQYAEYPFGQYFSNSNSIRYQKTTLPPTVAYPAFYNSTGSPYRPFSRSETNAVKVSLMFIARRRHFIGGNMTLRCEAKVLHLWNEHDQHVAKQTPTLKLAQLGGHVAGKFNAPNFSICIDSITLQSGGFKWTF